ncbi:RNA polymerase sigma factor [Flammeovirga kamogawensis]|uniref:RNA polymerase sigma factor n=1 Tax=Flammeovirga kamogawensis TaxID=373891 RepID=A0ABX8H035_9BACT|nr:RNA polymerase sigma factor [Flammeovirga kamogawensis]MBB6459466.1 RNA polymerase sigma-70 factor (ECF subfamily) [Flammeovirga kamogawensis]QWG09018.1 RNA polymerase sigma factor [Flammeovirga kamogawensis]TRX67306.1 RNA polymerase sigma factor [Flammeovirga kamogawensis]
MTAVEFNYNLQHLIPALEPFAYKLTKDSANAKDLIQETMLKAFSNKEKFMVGTNMKAWVFTIMRNTFLTNYQKSARQKTFIDTSENLHFINSTNVKQENSAYGNFAMNDIQKAIEELDDAYSEPFMMYFRGFKYHEISDRLSIPIGTVKNRIFLARKELKEVLSMYAN